MDKFLNRNRDKEKDDGEKSGSASSTLPKSTSTLSSVPKKRMYQAEYLGFGFIMSEKDASRPLCLICSAVLSNESMRPSKLKGHLETKHPELKHKPKEYFEMQLSSHKQQSKKIKRFTSTSLQAQIASFKIAHLLAKKKKSHTTAEEVIMPALEIAAECMLSNEAVEKFKSIPLSHHTVSRRIQDMSDDIKSQLRENFVDSSTTKLWAIQLDESTDISGKAQLLSFIRCIRNGRIINEYFFCRELISTSTGEDVFLIVNDSVKEFGLKWKDCVSVCTDGAPSMQGRNKGFVAHVLRQNKDVRIVHCMIHREVLVSKALPSGLSSTLNEVVKVVNYIKANPLRSRIFSALCEAMDSDYCGLLYHTEVRWLSKGKVLNRFVHMKTEVISFIESENVTFDFLKDGAWWLKVSFLSDLFDKFNAVNLSLQGACENFISLTGKLKSFQEKLVVWKRNVKNNIFKSFPTVDENPLKAEIKKMVEDTLERISASFDKYFPNLDVSGMEWVLNPFIERETKLEPETEENLIELRNDIIFKNLFAEKELSEFWICLNRQYPLLTREALKLLLPFGSSYLCEQGFSTLTEMKSKKRERLQIVDEEMRVSLSTTEPRLSLICSRKEAHVSH